MADSKIDQRVMAVNVKEKVKTHSEIVRHRTKGFFSEFMEFLKEYNVIQLAIGFVMAVAANQLVKSTVDNIIMPLISPIMPSERWQDAAFTFGKISIKWGQFVSDLIYFIIMAVIIFLFVKLILKETKYKKEK